MPAISSIELRPKRAGYRRLDFTVDGVSLLDKFSSLEFLEPEDMKLKPEGAEQLGTMLKRTLATRLGNGSIGWQVKALEQLLLHSKPELPDGRRRLYVCGGDCECSHVACFIESRHGLIIWRDFQRGSPAHIQAESHENGAWQLVDFGSGPGPKGFHLTCRPFSFEESVYQSVFEPLYNKLKDSEEPTT